MGNSGTDDSSRSAASSEAGGGRTCTGPAGHPCGSGRGGGSPALAPGAPPASGTGSGASGPLDAGRRRCSLSQAPLGLPANVGSVRASGAGLLRIRRRCHGNVSVPAGGRGGQRWGFGDLGFRGPASTRTSRYGRDGFREAIGPRGRLGRVASAVQRPGAQAGSKGLAPGDRTRS